MCAHDTKRLSFILAENTLVERFKNSVKSNKPNISIFK